MKVSDSGYCSGRTSQRSHASISLLIMDDDKAACNIIGRTIAVKFPDITIYKAYNSSIGIELFVKCKPDIVLTDINLPEMDGIEAARKIKSIKADTKFIVLTGHSEDNYLKKFLEIGYKDFIIKPVVLDRLFSAIENCRAEIAQQGRKDIFPAETASVPKPAGLNESRTEVAHERS